jgi:hypothetical protein
MSEQDKKIEAFIETGAELAGASVGGAIGFLAAGPAGAAGAGAAGVLIAKGAKYLLGDLVNRQMSHQETKRIGATAAIALVTIREKIQKGESPRNDGFFGGDADKRSSANEIFEGVLQKSKSEYEEKKLKFLGKFFANLAFAPAVTLGEANHYLNILDNLTYRQICILALIAMKEKSGSIFTLRKNNYVGIGGIDFESVSLLQEILVLNGYGLVLCKNPDDLTYMALLSWHYIVPDNLVLSDMGRRLVVLSEVLTLDVKDLNQMIRLLE